METLTSKYCPVCMGKGIISRPYRGDDGTTIYENEFCRNCNGKGYLFMGDDVMTNEDKLRSEIASYKGLANFLSKVWGDGGCKDCPAREICKQNQRDEILPCNEAVKIWLAQIAKE